MRPRVALYITCLVDLMRPSVGFAAVRLLEDAGCDVVVPPLQTCCGQPAHNAGDRASAAALAAEVVRACADADYVVVPSASCAGMIKHQYPKLLGAEAEALTGRVYELTAFLADVRGVRRLDTAFTGTVAYHDSCASLREMKSDAAARALIAAVPGARLAPLAAAEACCGFGGLFSIKYSEISGALAARKADAAEATGCDLLVGPDLGCLMNIAGTLSRRGSSIPCRHVAELLAGDFTDPPIAAARDGTP